MRCQYAHDFVEVFAAMLGEGWLKRVKDRPPLPGKDTRNAANLYDPVGSRRFSMRRSSLVHRDAVFSRIGVMVAAVRLRLPSTSLISASLRSELRAVSDKLLHADNHIECSGFLPIGVQSVVDDLQLLRRVQNCSPDLAGNVRSNQIIDAV
jgi:hypothetical protein